MFDTPVQSNYTCDEWTVNVSKADEQSPPVKHTVDPSGRDYDDPDGLLDDCAEALEPTFRGVTKHHPTHLKFIPPESRKELQRFWYEHPDLREACVGKYGHDPVENEDSYWHRALKEPEHADVLGAIKLNGGTFTLPLVKRWEAEEVAEAKVEKGSGHLYLISHAATRYNNPGQSKDRVQGWLNTPINAKGRREALKLGKFLKDKGITELHTSDLARADQTANIIGRHLGLTAKSSGKFRPWNLGDFAGHSSEEVIPKLKPFMEGKANEPVDGNGESFNTFKNRFVPALEGLLKKADSGKNIALVTHSRNIELAQGWMAGKRKRINTQAIDADKINPASVFHITDNKINELTDLSKAQAYPATLNLRVGGMHGTQDGQRVYRMFTRDGHYVGRTNPTTHRALKGDTLTVDAAHFSTDPQGDSYWLSPVVQGQSPDAPHSWKALMALAGAQGYRTMLKGGAAKDLGVQTVDTNNSYSAPGPAGQIPDPGDEYNASARIDQSVQGVEYDDVETGRQKYPGPETRKGRKKTIDKDGPTLEQVHVPAPMPNLSISYAATANRNKMVTLRPKKPTTSEFTVLKADQMKQVVYGVVLEPMVLDSQDDVMLPGEIEKTAHGYMKKAIRGKGSVSKLQHRTQGFFKNKPGLVPVESFIAPCDFSYDGKESVKKGTWVMAIHVEDPKVWQDVLDGKYTGFSIGGSGVRQSMDVREGHQWIGATQASSFVPQPPYLG